MTGRPYVVLSAAMSADGYIDDASGTRLVLSDKADLDRVDELRAASDAILVGARPSAQTIPGCWSARSDRRQRRLDTRPRHQPAAGDDHSQRRTRPAGPVLRSGGRPSR